MVLLDSAKNALIISLLTKKNKYSMKIHFLIFLTHFSLICFSQQNDTFSNRIKSNIQNDIRINQGGNNTKNGVVDTRRSGSLAKSKIQNSDARFKTLILEAEILFNQKRLKETKIKLKEALIIKPNQNKVISKIAKIDSILNEEELDKKYKKNKDSLLSIALSYQNENKFDSAIQVYKNELLKDDPKAMEGILFCKSHIIPVPDIVGSNENYLNLFKYLFYITCILILLLFIYLIKIKKQMTKNNSKFNEVKNSLAENINNFKTAITSINSLLNVLSKEEIISNYNDKIRKIDEMPVESIDQIFIDLNNDLKEIEKQAKEIEKNHLESKTILEEIENVAQLPPRELAAKYSETALELNKVKNELKNKTIAFDATVSLNVPHFGIPDGIYINSNILVSPGPRKDKDNDTELGEDATGILNTQYGSFFWILDGTSDSPSISNGKEHIFSSRILAQLMNKNIREELHLKSNENINLKEILINSVESSKKDLIEKLNNSPNDILEKIEFNIKSNNPPFCSTTVLIGFLSKQGTLQYFYLGDSEVLSFYNISDKLIANEKDKNENPSRLFISIQIGENSFVLKTNLFDEKLVAYKKENIDLVVAFSDGIGTSEKSLLVNPALSLSKISLVNQLTYDDKTLLVLERTKK